MENKMASKFLVMADKLTNDGSTTPAGLVAASLAHGFGLFVGVSVSANISGGHVNPAVTFGAFMGGNISLLRGIMYWIAQCLGSVVACLLLKFSTGGLVRHGYWNCWQAFQLENNSLGPNSGASRINDRFDPYQFMVHGTQSTTVDLICRNFNKFCPLANSSAQCCDSYLWNPNFSDHLQWEMLHCFSRFPLRS